MIHTAHLLKVTAIWVSIVDIVCFVGVALFPNIRPNFLYYGLHSAASTGEAVLTVTTFLSGLVIWNVIAFFAVGLFALVYNRTQS